MAAKGEVEYDAGLQPRRHRQVFICQERWISLEAKDLYSIGAQVKNLFRYLSKAAALELERGQVSTCGTAELEDIRITWMFSDSSISPAKSRPCQLPVVSCIESHITRQSVKSSNVQFRCGVRARKSRINFPASYKSCFANSAVGRRWTLFVHDRANSPFLGTCLVVNHDYSFNRDELMAYSRCCWF